MLVVEGMIFFKGELTRGSVGIEDGKIIDVKKILKGDKNIDLGDKIIIPGAVDPHVHFRDPGMKNKEDFISGSLSALYGGVTCVLDMPNTKPPVIDIRSLKEKKRVIKGRSFTDYGLFAALTKNCNVSEIKDSVCGFKMFMGSTTGEILMNDDNEIKKAMTKAAQTGKRVSVHAEDNDLINNKEENNNRDHLRNRPLKAEHNAIMRLSAYKGMNINICHITDAASAELSSSLGFTTEVTMHHLFLSDSISKSAEYKVNPPLRDTNTRDGLFNAFNEDRITMFGSDHAPHTTDEKQRSYDDAPSGITGVETYLPIMMNMVKKGVVPLERVVRMSSYSPALSFSMNKGKIEKGYDADLAVFDTKKVKKIRSRDLHSKCSHTPYEGWDAIFPDMVFLRGEMQIKNGDLCGEMLGSDINE